MTSTKQRQFYLVKPSLLTLKPGRVKVLTAPLAPWLQGLQANSDTQTLKAFATLATLALALALALKYL